MREPIGTTRKGQVLLGALGLVIGVGCGYGLIVEPETFEPTLKFAFYVLGRLTGENFRYDPSQRMAFAVLLPALGALWALLFAYAFAREPARNRSIDAYLRRKNELDTSRRAKVVSQDDMAA